MHGETCRDPRGSGNWASGADWLGRGWGCLLPLGHFCVAIGGPWGWGMLAWVELRLEARPRGRILVHGILASTQDQALGCPDPGLCSSQVG